MDPIERAGISGLVENDCSRDAWLPVAQELVRIRETLHRLLASTSPRVENYRARLTRQEVLAQAILNPDEVLERLYSPGELRPGYDFAWVWDLIRALERELEDTSRSGAVSVEAPAEIDGTLIDIDFEYSREGCQIVLYLRDISDTGISYAVLVPGYTDHFYVDMGSPGFKGKEHFFEAVEKAFKGALFYHSKKARQEAHSRRCGSLMTAHNTSFSVSYPDSESKSIYGYQPESARLARVDVSHPALLRSMWNKLRKFSFDYESEEPLFEPLHIGSSNSSSDEEEEFGRGIQFDSSSMTKTWEPCAADSLEFYHANIAYLTKFTAEKDIGGYSTVRVSNCRAMIPGHRTNLTTCSYLVKVRGPDFITRSPNQVVRLPRTLYFDIECLSPGLGVFPEARKGDPVIQISYYCASGTTADSILQRGILCLRETDSVTGDDGRTEWFHTETQLLYRFAQLVVKDMDPDVICGFNSNAFDMPYILERAAQLCGGKRVKATGWANFFRRAMTHLGRRRGAPTTFTKREGGSNQSGAREVYTYVLPGRTMFDHMAHILASRKLESYSLKNICIAAKVDDGKEDLNYRDIPPLFRSREGRTRIASYCLKDTELLLKLDDNWMLTLNLVELCKILGISLSDNLYMGSMFKLTRKILQYSLREKFLLPSIDYADAVRRGGVAAEGEKYQGATVLEPEIGHHEDPVAVLDFASLYPSIMRGWNLSFDTFVAKDRLEELITQGHIRDSDLEITPLGDRFVKQTVREGLLGMIERELMTERSRVKKEMKVVQGKIKQHEGDEALVKRLKFDLGVLDAKQLAVKVVCNSLYGMCGSKYSPIPMVQVAAGITSIGREQIELTKKFCEEHSLALTGLTARVIYGDTDSVFVKFTDARSIAGPDQAAVIKAAIDASQKLEHAINAQVYHGKRDPMSIEYEKLFFPFTLLRKKKYLSRKFEFNPDPAAGKLSASGVEIVRRDNTKMTREIMQDFAKAVYEKMDVQAALKGVEDFVGRHLRGELDISYYKIGKKLNKPKKQPPGHYIAWEAQVKRCGVHNAPTIGERFEYVVIDYNRSKKISSQYVDYPLAEEQNLPMDKLFYLEKMIAKPLGRIMEHIIGAERTSKFFVPNRFERHTEVSARAGNILGAFGKGESGGNSQVRIKIVKRPLGNAEARKKLAKQTKLNWGRPVDQTPNSGGEEDKSSSGNGNGNRNGNGNGQVKKGERK